MATPRLNGRGLRRYPRKREHKEKKRDSKTYKVPPSQANHCLPKITQKRLTNKRGFCFKGALNTSPRQRILPNVHENQKPKRGSADFDLLCLLKAAKSKDPSGHLPSASGSTSSLVNSSCTFVESFPEEFREKIKPSKITGHHIPQKKRRESQPESSSESNVSSLTENNKAENVTPNMREAIDPFHDDFDASNQGSQRDDSIPLSPQFNSNKSTENSAPQPPFRPCSLLSFQKFARRLVEAFVAEKKTQLPSQNWLGKTGNDLYNIYNQSHGIQLQQSLEKTEHILPRNYAPGFKDQMNKQIGTKMGVQDKTECLRESVSIAKFKNPPVTHTQEERLFRENSIKAWVNAIPENVPNKHCDEFSNKYKFNPRNEPHHVVTEREFLKNVKENRSAFKFFHVNGSSVPQLSVGDVDAFSPFPPQIWTSMPQTNREPINKSHNVWVPFLTGKSAYHVEEAVFSPISAGFSFDPPFPLKTETNIFNPVLNNDSAVQQNRMKNELVSWSTFPEQSKIDLNKAGHGIADKVTHGTQQNKDVRFSPRFMF